MRKNVFVVLQDFQVDVMDTLPNTIYSSSSTGRILYMDKGSNLSQYSLTEQKKLPQVFIGTRAPRKITKVLDSVFDDNTNRLYVLTNKWIVEVWEPINQ